MLVSGEKGTLIHCWWDCKLSIATMENWMEIPQKIKNTALIWPTNSTLGYLSKKHKNTYLERYTPPYVQYSITRNSQDIDTTYISTNRWMDTGWYTDIYIHNGISLSESNAILLFVTPWIDPVGTVLSRVSQTEEHTPYNFTHMWKLKKKRMNKWNKTQPEIQRTSRWLPKQEGSGEDGNKEKEKQLLCKRKLVSWKGISESLMKHTSVYISILFAPLLWVGEHTVTGHRLTFVD